jgi:hypothetical protein
MTTAPNSSALATDSNAVGIGCDALFDLDSVALDSPRLTALKAADIQTHHAPHMEDDPWLAVPMNAAREMLKGYNLKEEESGSVAGIMEGYCGLLDEAGMTFTGQTERYVQDDALHSLSNAKHSRTNNNEKL